MFNFIQMTHFYIVGLILHNSLLTIYNFAFQEELTAPNLSQTEAIFQG